MGLMERGLSEVSEPCLLSVTYKSPGKLSEMVENPVGVERAKADWRAFMWFVKQRHPRLQWFKVPELTKRGQLHWHALIGNLEPGSVDACEKKANYSQRWRAKDCDCLEHQWSRHWEYVTGDSYVVDVERVWKPSGAVSYLVKYLKKGMYGKVREGLEALGFKRRFSCSRGWPRGSQMQRRGSLGDPSAWVSTSFAYGRVEAPKLEGNAKDGKWFEQVGEDLVSATIRLRKERKRIANLHEKVRTKGSLGGV